MFSNCTSCVLYTIYFSPVSQFPSVISALWSNETYKLSLGKVVQHVSNYLQTDFQKDWFNIRGDIHKFRSDTDF